MPNPVADVFVPFRFKVNLYDSEENTLLCSGKFSEVSGFELTMEPKTFQEGGRNWGEIHRTGQTKFAPMTLKRGVTSINDLWSWFDATTRGANYGYRLSGEIIVLGHQTQNGEDNPVMTWKLTGVMATKFKGPDLNSTASQVAIEEVQLVHEGLELERTKQADDQSSAANSNTQGALP